MVPWPGLQEAPWHWQAALPLHWEPSLLPGWGLSQAPAAHLPDPELLVCVPRTDLTVLQQEAFLQHLSNWPRA